MGIDFSLLPPVQELKETCRRELKAKRRQLFTQGLLTELQENKKSLQVFKRKINPLDLLNM